MTGSSASATAPWKRLQAGCGEAAASGGRGLAPAFSAPHEEGVAKGIAEGGEEDASGSGSLAASSLRL